MVQPDRPNTRSLWFSLIVLCIGQTMIVIDQNIVNVALPTVQRSLGFSSANLVWVVNAYVIPFGGLLMLAGRLGDLISRRTVFITGITLFSAASLLCGFASTEAMLIVFRFIQGIGGAVASACILGMVATMFTEPKQRAQAIGAYSFASAGGGALGQLLGGVLTEWASWNWIFFINAPIGALVVLGTFRVVPKDKGLGLRNGADYLGALLVTAGVMLAVYTIVNAEQAGWGSVQTLVFAAVAIVLLVGFFVREATAASPLLPLRLFKSRNVAGANVVQFVLIAGMFGLLFYGMLYVQRVLGYNSLEAGLAYIPIAVVIAAISVALSARLIMKFGQRTMLLSGLVLIIAAFILLGLARADGTYMVDFLPATLLMGIGVGVAIPAVMGLGMSAVAPEDAGIASGVFNTSQQIGGAIGLTVISAFVGARTSSLTTSGAAEREALLGGYHLGFFLAAGFTVIAFIVAAAMLKPSPAPKQPATDDEGEHSSISAA